MAEIEALQCKTEAEIEEARVRLLGKKGEITALFEDLLIIPESYLKPLTVKVTSVLLPAEGAMTTLSA